MNLSVRIHVTCDTDAGNRQPVGFGVLSASGYRYVQQLNEQSHDRLLITVPPTLAGTTMVAWTNVGSARIQFSTIELTNNWQGVVKTADDRSVKVKVEWYDGDERIIEDMNSPCDHENVEVSESYNAWQFIEQVRAMEGHDLVFRGEYYPYHGPMRSPLARRWCLSEEDLNRHTRALLREARRYKGVCGTDEQVMAECQHMGIEMNVLDFTKSPLVALWFAAQRAADPTDGRVLVVNPNECRRPMIDTHLASKRMDAQFGVLLHDCPMSAIVAVFPVKASWKKPICELLRDVYGICNYTLFPGIESLAEDIRLDKVKFTSTQEKAAFAALDRGDYKVAITLLEDVAEWHAAQNMRNDGGYFNGRRFSNLACALAMDGQFSAARKAASRALRSAELSGNERQVRVAQGLLEGMASWRVRMVQGLLKALPRKGMEGVTMINR